MSKKDDFDFLNVCRTCLSTGDLKSLYDEDEGLLQDTFAEMLMMCTLVQYYEHDTLPAQICAGCIDELNRSYKFALKCRESDDKLRIFQQKCVPENYAQPLTNSHSQTYEPENEQTYGNSISQSSPELQNEQSTELLSIKEEIDSEDDIKPNPPLIDSLEIDKDIGTIEQMDIKLEPENKNIPTILESNSSNNQAPSVLSNLNIASSIIPTNSSTTPIGTIQQWLTIKKIVLPVTYAISKDESVDSIIESPVSKFGQPHLTSLEEFKSCIIKKGGSHIFDYYNANQTLDTRHRRKLVNITVDLLVHLHGYRPASEIKLSFAKLIVELLPNLKEKRKHPNQREDFGCSAFYGFGGQGYIAWRLRTIIRLKRKSKKCERKNEDTYELTPNLNGITASTSTATVPSSDSETLHDSDSDDDESTTFKSIVSATYDDGSRDGSFELDLSQSDPLVDLTSMQELKDRILKKDGADIFEFYNDNQILNNVYRKKLVNITVDLMVKQHGFKPSTEIKLHFAKLIIKLFPNLKDRNQQNSKDDSGCGAFFSLDNGGQGYISWRLRNVARHTPGATKKRHLKSKSDESTAKKSKTHESPRDLNASVASTSSELLNDVDNIKIENESCTPIESVNLPTLLDTSMDTLGQTFTVPNYTSSQDLQDFKSKIILRGGADILNFYKDNLILNNTFRRKLVNITVDLLIDLYGYKPAADIKSHYAYLIIQLFPNLKDNCAKNKNGSEAFFSPENGGQGYIAWRLRNVARHTPGVTRKRTDVLQLKEPLSTKKSYSQLQLNLTETDKNAISFLKTASFLTDRDAIFKNMALTFHLRKDYNADLFELFPRFLDTPGLIEQDFNLLYPAAKQFENIIVNKCEMILKTYIKTEKTLDEVITNINGWDKITRSMFALLQMLPPTARGKSRPKVTVSTARSKLIVFKEPNVATAAILANNTENNHPFLIAEGVSVDAIDNYLVVIDAKCLPCPPCTPAQAFAILFQAHTVFQMEYDGALDAFWRFVKGVFYEIEPNQLNFTSKMRELRSRLDAFCHI